MAGTIIFLKAIVNLIRPPLWTGKLEDGTGVLVSIRQISCFYLPRKNTKQCVALLACKMESGSDHSDTGKILWCDHESYWAVISIGTVNLLRS